MNQSAVKHLEEVEEVLRSSKGLNSLLEFWAFRAAFNEVSSNLSYINRQDNDEINEEAREFVSILERLHWAYNNVLTTKHYYELDNQR